MDWKKLGKRLLFPPVWAVVLLTIASTVALISVFQKGLETAIIAYVVYVVAFYTLVTVCAYCIVYLPGYIRRTREKINDNPLGHRMLSEASFRTHISLYLSLCASLLYVGLNIFFYVENDSMWFVILAVYYTILVIVRLILAKYVRKDSNGTNQLRELKLNRPVMTTVRAIQLFAALVSMLSLETAMFEEFGQNMSLENKRLFIMLTGAGISITVLIMSIYMIVKSVKTIKNIKE